MARITVMTAGQLSTCPRMLKAAEALAADGHQVRAVSSNFVSWGAAADAELRQRLRMPWEIVDYSRSTGNRVRISSGVRFHLCRRLASAIGPERLPEALLGRAKSRVFSELLHAAAAQPADLLYGGGGGLMATACAARRMRIPYAVDLEDFHGAEQPPETAGGALSNRLAQAAEAVVFREAALLTTASEAIAQSYAERYGRRPIVINNTFPLPAREPEIAPVGREGLRLYWFSQTIGPGRGLEDAIRAAGLAGVRCELNLRGNPSSGYFERLRALAKECAPALTLVHHAPESPDRMVELCRGYHVGLALEPGFCLNNSLALSNKAFTYILAGLAVAFTDTPGQRELARDLGAGALLYKPGEIDSLARGLGLWSSDPAQLLAARRAAWEAARRRWHWEHELERGALLRAVREALP